MTKTARLRAFQHQIQRLQHRLGRLRQISNRFAWARAVLFFGGLLLSGVLWFFFGLWMLAVALLITGVVFAVTVRFHQKLDHEIARYQAWREIKQTQIARMQIDWPNIPLFSQRQPRYSHPFEADFDLVGEQSLHQLLDTTVSLEGSQKLRDWLVHPQPALYEIERRQALVRELTPRFLFRHKLIANPVVAANTRKFWDSKRLMTWLGHPADASVRGWLVGFSLLAGLNIVLLLLNGLGLIPALWPATLALYFGLLVLKSGSTKGTFHEATGLQDALRQLEAIFHQLESYSYRQTPHLKKLCAPFLDRAHRPSTYVTRINRLVVAVGLRENPFMWLLLNAFFPWDFFFADRLAQAKTQMAQDALLWLETWFELEALSALANLAYLNPAYTMPEISGVAAGHQGPVFQVKEAGHPLIRDEEKVCNDFAMNEIGEVVIITGSNMAGKSTFLRTIGVNLALAFAGGPVDATCFRTRLFRLFSCIKVSDSLVGGISYFYAEVKRLKALLSELERDDPLPLFFFIDEIFRGTNNRERLIGSRAYLRTLVTQQGVGLIATHDLELVRLADQNPQIKNYHFRDEVEDNRMVFDYKLHPGPCPTTNALKIMRMEGLPVNDGRES